METSPDEQSKLVWGVIAATTALYGFFLKHVIGHCVKQEVQTKASCIEIVKRFDDGQEQINKKLDKLLEYHMKQ